MTKNKQIYVKAVRRSIAIQYFGLDVRKDFFSLSNGELARLNTLRMVCNFRGDNELGRSRCRQFWYHLQAGEPLPFEEYDNCYES